MTTYIYGFVINGCFVESEIKLHAVDGIQPTEVIKGMFPHLEIFYINEKK